MPSKPKRFIPPNSYRIKDSKLSHFQYLLQDELEAGQFTQLIEHQIIAALKSRNDCLIVIKGKKNPDTFLVIPAKSPNLQKFPGEVSLTIGQLTTTLTIPDTFLHTANNSPEPLALVARVTPTKPPRSR